MGGIPSLLAQAKDLAKRYWALTGKLLDVTGEVAEYAAAENLAKTISRFTPIYLAQGRAN